RASPFPSVHGPSSLPPRHTELRAVTKLAYHPRSTCAGGSPNGLHLAPANTLRLANSAIINAMLAARRWRRRTFCEFSLGISFSDVLDADAIFPKPVAVDAPIARTEEHLIHIHDGRCMMLLPERKTLRV